MSLQQNNDSSTTEETRRTPTHDEIQDIPRETDHIIVCGSRNIDSLSEPTGKRTVASIFNTLFKTDDTQQPVLVHGDSRGVDEYANEWAKLKNDWPIIAIEADWDNIDHPEANVKENKHGKYDASAGVRRNIHMAKFIKHRQIGDGFNTYCIAIMCPDESGNSSGTESMIKQFRKHHDESNLLIIPVGEHWQKIEPELRQFMPSQNRTWGAEYYGNKIEAENRIEALIQNDNIEPTIGKEVGAKSGNHSQVDFEELEPDEDENPDRQTKTEQFDSNANIEQHDVSAIEVNLCSDYHKRWHYVDEGAEERGLNRRTFASNRDSIKEIPEDGHYTIVSGNRDVTTYISRREILTLLKLAIPIDTDCIITEQRTNSPVDNIAGIIALENDIPHIVVPTMWNYTDHPKASEGQSEKLGEYDKTAGFRRNEQLCSFLLDTAGDGEIIGLFGPNDGRNAWTAHLFNELLSNSPNDVSDYGRILPVGNNKNCLSDKFNALRVNQNQDEIDKELQDALTRFDDTRF